MQNRILNTNEQSICIYLLLSEPYFLCSARTSFFRKKQVWLHNLNRVFAVCSMCLYVSIARTEHIPKQHVPKLVVEVIFCASEE